jgi:hypothetical protein
MLMLSREISFFEVVVLIWVIISLISVIWVADAVIKGAEMTETSVTGWVMSALLLMVRFLLSTTVMV